MKKIIIFYLLILFQIELFGQCPTTPIELINQSQIDDFSINNPGCTNLLNDLTIDGVTSTAINNLDGLSVISSIDGNLIITDNDNSNFVNLNGLSNVNDISGALTIEGNEFLQAIDLTTNTAFQSHVRISDNPSLTNLAIGGSFNTIGGNFQIYGNNNLTTLSGFPNLIIVSDVCNIQDLASNDLSFLSSLQQVGTLGVHNCNNLSDLTGLENIQTIWNGSIVGGIGFSNNDNLVSLNGLGDITTPSEIGDLTVSNNPNLTDISDLNSITEIRRLTISDNNSLTTLNGLQNIANLNDDIIILGNASLNSINQLSNITSINGIISLNNNDNLTSLMGIDNIDPMSISNISLTNSNALSSCSVQSVCDWIDQNPGAANITNNTTGCNNEAEVEAACSSCVTINGGTTIEVTNTSDSGAGSLRNAIECANSEPLLDIIAFTTTGVISILNPLPDITDDGLHIDGGMDIEIDGSLISAGEPAIVIESDLVTIEKFTINSAHIQVHGSSNNILMNTINNSGIQFLGSNNLADQNNISGNLNGVQCQFNDGNVISNNEIFDCTRGVTINSGSNNNQITQNEIYCNLELGISNAGNSSILAPIISESTTFEIVGSSGSNESIEVFLHSESGCIGVPCQGKTYLTTISSDAFGDWTWNPVGQVSAGDVITATATDFSGNTSGFSECAEVVLPCPDFVVSLSASPNPACLGTADILYTINFSDGQGPYDVDWTNGGSLIDINDGYSEIFTLGTSGVYVDSIISAVDDNGCEATIDASSSVSVIVNDIPDVNISVVDNSVCEGSDIEIIETGGDAIEWNWLFPNGELSNSPSPLINNVTIDYSGTYQVTVTDINDCTSTAEINITVNPLPQFSFLQDNPYQVCKGIFDSNNPLYIVEIDNTNLLGNESITWDLTNAIGLIGFESYDQYIIDNEFSTTTNGFPYQLCANIIDNNNCERQECIDIEIIDQPVIGSFSSSDISCGATVTDITTEYLSFSGASSFEVNLYNCDDQLLVTDVGNGMTVFENVDITTNNCFYVEIVDQTYFCSAISEQLTITPQDGTEVQLSGDSEVCSDNMATIQVDNAIDYDLFEWSTSEMTSQISVSPTITTSYSVTATEANGCENIATWEVEVNGISTFNISGDFSFCTGSNTTLSVANNPDYEYQWFDGQTVIGTDNSMVFDQVGEYSLEINDEMCVLDTTFQIMEIDGPSVSVTDMISVCNEDIGIPPGVCIDFNAQVNGDNGSWVDASLAGVDLSDLTLVCFDGVSIGQYDFIYTTMIGNGQCEEVSDTMMVVVDNCDCPNFNLNTIPNQCNDSPNPIELNAFLNSNGNTGAWSEVPSTSPSGNLVNNEFLVDGIAEGTYQVQWTIDNQIVGCPTADTTEIVVYKAPSTGFNDASLFLCNEENSLGDYEIDLNSLLSMDSDAGGWEQTEGISIDTNLPIVNTVGRSIGESFQFMYTTNNAISPCQEAMATATITVVDCNCPIVELNTDTLCNASMNTLDLNSLIHFNSNNLSGTWSSPMDGPNQKVPDGNLSNDNINPSMLASGLYDLVFTFVEDPGENCPTEWTTTVLIQQQPVAESGMDGQVCNSSSSGGETVIDLYSLLDPGYTTGGIWNLSSGNPITIEVDGTVDFEGTTVGDLYTFNYSISNVDVCSPLSVDVNVIINDCDCFYAGVMTPDTLCNEGSALLDINSLLDPGSDSGEWQVLSGGLTIGLEPGDFLDPMRESGDYQICYSFVPEPSSSSCPQDTCVLLHIAEQKIGNLLLSNDIICNNDLDGNENIYNLDLLVDTSAPYDANGNWVQIGGSVTIDLSNTAMVSFDESIGVNLGDVFNFEYVVSSISPCNERRYPFSLTVDCTNCDDLPVISIPVFCNNDGILDLRDFETDRSGGIWSSSNITIDNNTIDLSNVNPGNYNLTYEVPDPQPAPCQNEVAVTLQIDEVLLPIISGNNYCNNMDSIDVLIENPEGFNDILWQTGATTPSVKISTGAMNELDLMTTDLNGCEFLTTIPIYGLGIPGEACTDANGFPGILDDDCNCITDSECNILCNDDFAYIVVQSITSIDILENDILPMDISWEVINTSNDIIKVWEENQNGMLELEITENFFDTLYVTYHVCKEGCSDCQEGKLALLNEALRDVVQTNIITPNGDGSNDVLRFTIDDVMENSELWIYNRWGDRIFHMKNYDNGWSADGYPGGIYFYVFRVNGVDIKKTLTVVK